MSRGGCGGHVCKGVGIILPREAMVLEPSRDGKDNQLEGRSSRLTPRYRTKRRYVDARLGRSDGADRDGLVPRQPSAT